VNSVELLAPGGNLEKLKTAINYGADAVYVGGSKLNLRAFSDNFSLEELKEGIEYAHERGKKVFLTLNVFPHNEDLVGLEEYVREIYEIGIDAAIVSDPGIIEVVRQTVPELELHLSTQANNVNWKSAEFWHKNGVKRIVLARELSLKEIGEFRKRLPESCELEAFVHGAMCMSYSGRCLLSNYMTGRDSNRGACAQPCRYKYYLVEEKRPGEYFPVMEDDKGTYIMNSKDLCMIEYIPELINSGIKSFKIEGRMKSSFYVAAVVKAYREAIDSYLADSEDYKFNPKWMDYVNWVSHRHYSTGFYFPGNAKQYYENSSYIRDYDIVGVVKEYDLKAQRAIIEQRNRVFEGDIAEVLSPSGEPFSVALKDMRNEENDKIEVAPSAQMIFSISCTKPLKKEDMLIKAKEVK